MEYLKKFENFKNSEIKKGEYILYNFLELPIPIKITSIDHNLYEFESMYNLTNKDYWEKKFIGTEMEGIGYDPFGSEFYITNVDKIEGNKIYLKSKLNEELKHSTYIKASNRLNRMGHVKRAKRLKEHSDDKQIEKTSKKWGVGKLELEGGVTAELHSIGYQESIDFFFDTEKEEIGIPIFLRLPVEWDGSRIYSIIYFLNLEDDKFYITSYDEEAFEEVYGKPYLKFSNRKDAFKIFKILKSINMDDYLTSEDPNERKEYKKAFNSLLDSITVNNLYGDGTVDCPGFECVDGNIDCPDCDGSGELDDEDCPYCGYWEGSD
jgi:hypothetical protein